MDPIRRVTAPTIEVLRELLENPNSIWGLKIAKQIGRAPGTVYPILARLEDSSWVVGHWDEDDGRSTPRRRMYTLTEEGAANATSVVATWDARPSTGRRRQSDAVPA